MSFDLHFIKKRCLYNVFVLFYGFLGFPSWRVRIWLGPKLLLTRTHKIAYANLPQNFWCSPEAQIRRKIFNFQCYYNAFCWFLLHSRCLNTMPNLQKRCFLQWHVDLQWFFCSQPLLSDRPPQLPPICSRILFRCFQNASQRLRQCFPNVCQAASVSLRWFLDASLVL